jgi:hypothetical protein
MVVEIIDLPRDAYRILPPRRWQIALTLAVIVVTVILWTVT